MADDSGFQKNPDDHEKAPEPPLTRSERSLLRRLSTALRLADFIAVMMVAATGFSAFASWRIAQLSHTILVVSERPYLGVQEVKFDTIDTVAARIKIETRNFGSVSASDVVSQIRMLVDGHQIAGYNRLTATVNLGLASPSVPHMAYRFLPLATYQDVRDGKARLAIDVLIEYRGPDARQFCYNEIISYDRQSDTFGATGGGDRCDGQIF